MVARSNRDGGRYREPELLTIYRVRHEAGVKHFLDSRAASLYAASGKSKLPVDAERFVSVDEILTRRRSGKARLIYRVIEQRPDERRRRIVHRNLDRRGAKAWAGMWRRLHRDRVVTVEARGIVEVNA